MKAKEVGDVSLEKMLMTEALQLRVEQRKIDRDFQGEAFDKIKLQTLAMAFRQLEMANCPKPVPGETNHGFIPLPCRTFIDIMIEAFITLGKTPGKRFLDVGCGIGTKVLLAKAFFDSHGIEIEDRSVGVAQIIGADNVIKGDCLTYDKYDEFDFLYFFRPIRDFDKEAEFENRIHDQMKPGAVIAPIYTQLDWDKFDDLTKIGWIYQKSS